MMQKPVTLEDIKKAFDTICDKPYRPEIFYGTPAQVAAWRKKVSKA